MLALDYKKGGGKRTIKQGLFATPFLRASKEERGQRSKTPPFSTLVAEGLERAGSSYTSWGPNICFEVC